jgi:hypothetical protein
MGLQYFSHEFDKCSRETGPTCPMTLAAILESEDSPQHGLAEAAQAHET